jgi:aminodeoxyfutalosine synthase
VFYSSFFGARRCGCREVSHDSILSNFMNASPTAELQITDSRLRPITAKVLAGERLTPADGVTLYRSPDLLAVGWLANHIREARHGDVCYFNVNRHINPTNVCVAHCKLCAFGRDPNAPGAYTFALEEIWQRAEEGVRAGATEFHMVGGLHPDLPFEYFLEMIRGLKKRCPAIHLKAFTMVEVGYFARISKLSIRETLLAMKEAGVDSLPGGGAEIFNPRVRRVICDHKTSGRQWLEIARTAHEIGLRSNATMLYGHIENEEERVEHLLLLRELQDDTHGFQTFIPLAFHPENTALAHLPKPTGFDDLRNIAVSRLLLDNFDHIKAYWVMLTPRIAQIALRFGADDIDGTIIEEKIYHDAGATTAQFTSRSELERLIRAAGRTPVERDTLYHPVVRTGPVPDLAPAPAGPGFVPSTTLTLNV